MERRRLDSMSLSLSISTQNAQVHPKEELRAGVFDLEKSHLSAIMPFETSSTENASEIINEAAIDAFLEEEKVYQVDVKKYLEAVNHYMISINSKGVE